MPEPVQYADIIVDISSSALDRVFQYMIPPELAGDIKIGTIVMVPFGRCGRLLKGYVVGVSAAAEIAAERIKAVSSIAADAPGPEERLVKLAAWMRERFGGTMLQALRTVLPVKKKVRQREKRILSLAVPPQEAAAAADEMQRKHYTARERLMRALIEEPELAQDLVIDKLNIQTSVIRALQTRGLIRVTEQVAYRNPGRIRADGAGRKLQLTTQQRNALDTILSRWDDDSGKGRYLIHGVTGSGKTLVYLELVEEAVRRGEQAIVLIPEIALTYQTVLRFYRRFADRVSFINSRLSDGERYDQYERAKRGEIDVMIGPRSALFTPFPNLGIIVIDEEHERSYISETVPRYNTRETAFARAGIEGARVVLGSATPSLEAYHAARTGRITLLKMSERAGGAQLPQVQIVDLRKELKNGNRTMFSQALREQILACHERGEQSMLFLNRRGFAGFLSCRSCGYVVTCPHCDVSLSVHRGSGKMICHYCGYEETIPTVCPQCASEHLRMFRAGTEQIEAELKKLFPMLRVLRMDADTTRQKEAHTKILSAFSGHEADLLIGTQMIVKGHDFPDVTLVGILAADLSLHVPDYRAAERTFQLLTQAAGRAGRADRPGQVIIQTYDPDHYSIRCAAAQDYESFYEKEMDFRSMALYPPAGHLMIIHLSGTDEARLATAAGYLKLFAVRLAKNRTVSVLGPADEPVAKISDTFRKMITLKGTMLEELGMVRDRLQEYIRINEGFRGIQIQFETE